MRKKPSADGGTSELWCTYTPSLGCMCIHFSSRVYVHLDTERHGEEREKVISHIAKRWTKHNNKVVIFICLRFLLLQSIAMENAGGPKGEGELHSSSKLICLNLVYCISAAIRLFIYVGLFPVCLCIRDASILVKVEWKVYVDDFEVIDGVKHRRRLKAGLWYSFASSDEKQESSSSFLP